MYNRKLLFLFILISFATLVGCGGGDKDDDTSCEEDWPIGDNYINASTIEAGKAYTYQKLSKQIAIKLPESANGCLLNITNLGNTCSFSVYQRNNYSLRATTEIASDSLETEVKELSPIVGVDYSDRIRAHQVSMEVRRRFAMNALRGSSSNSNKNASIRADLSQSVNDHSHETVGNEYTIYTGTVDDAPMATFNRCKLVAITEHAKFFVDQNTSYYGVSYDPSLMENWVTEGEFSFTNMFDNGTEECMYNVLKKNFGTVADVDNDGKLSILITPALSRWQNGLEGLFPEETMLVDGSEKYIDKLSLPEYRDLIMIGPISSGSSNYKRHEMLINLLHETQHAINFSLRAFSGNEYIGFDPTGFAEELGFDEGCSIYAECMYRRARANRSYTTLYDYKTGSSGTEYTGNSNRFSILSSVIDPIQSIVPFSNFNYDTDYGLNGLFMLYLSDRFGAENFKKVVQQGWLGSRLEDKIPEILGFNGKFSQLQSDWHFAIQNEAIKTANNNADAVAYVSSDYKYKDYLRLPIKNRATGDESKSIQKNSCLIYKVNGNTTITINASIKTLFETRIMKLP